MGIMVKMLVSVTSPHGAPAAGEVIELPAEIAQDWARAGYCEILEVGEEEAKEIASPPASKRSRKKE
jgi:hypothetical protein